jgi:glycosyl transferase, family 25
LQSLPVYVISLHDAVERRALIKKHLDSLDIAHEIIDAVRGDALSPEFIRKVNPTRNMSPGQIGCYLSHIHVYERMIEHQIPVALILEDDSTLHPSIKVLIKDGCKSVDFDYCFLGSDDRGDAGYVFFDAAKPVPLGGQHCGYPLSAGPFGTYSYLVSLDGAKKRVSCAYPIKSAIDHYQFLPYQPRYIATIPMMTSMNKLSAVQSISSINWSSLQNWTVPSFPRPPFGGPPVAHHRGGMPQLIS